MTMVRNLRRFAALTILALIASFPAPAEGSMAQCFQQCEAMENGCPDMGGDLYGSCTYNPGLPENDQCKLPGCYCEGDEEGICGGEGGIPE